MSEMFITSVILLLLCESSKSQKVNTGEETGNVAITKPEVNSEVHCQCTCNPVNNKHSILYANGQLTLELQEQRENNQQQKTVDRPPVEFKMKKNEPKTSSSAKNVSQSNSTSNSTMNQMTANSTSELAKNNETNTVLAENFVRELPPSILSNPTDIEKMIAIDGFSQYYQKLSLKENENPKSQKEDKRKKGNESSNLNTLNKKTPVKHVDTPPVTFVGEENNRKSRQENIGGNSTRNANSRRTSKKKSKKRKAPTRPQERAYDQVSMKSNNDVTVETSTEIPVKDLVIGRPFQDTEVLVTRKIIPSEFAQDPTYLIDGQPFDPNQNTEINTPDQQSLNQNSQLPNNNRWMRKNGQDTTSIPFEQQRNWQRNGDRKAPQGDWQNSGSRDPLQRNWQRGGVSPPQGDWQRGNSRDPAHSSNARGPPVSSARGPSVSVARGPPVASARVEWGPGNTRQQWPNKNFNTYEVTTRPWRPPPTTVRGWNNRATGIPIVVGRNWRGNNQGPNFDQRPTHVPQPRGPPVWRQ